jgi:hypothetical protein
MEAIMWSGEWNEASVEARRKPLALPSRVAGESQFRQVHGFDPEQADRLEIH